MTHLHDTEIVDFIEGTLPPARAAHLASCDSCRSQAEAARATLAVSQTVPDHEPSPVFWDHFAARVNQRIDAAPPARWFALPGLAFVGLGTVAAVLLAVLVLPTPEEPLAPDAPAVAGNAEVLTISEPDDPDADPEWAVVRAAAEDMDFDAAQAAGLATRAGTVERVAMEMTDEERAELIRLVENEIKRSGA